MVDIEINKESCIGCGVCVNSCPVGVFEMEEDKAVTNGNIEDCTLCKTCESSCPAGAITVT
ncbi:MAG: 4Fe-4S binding protein [Candidatus Altiarchaeota archaeon]|nr:4Fe-4S binding protein [Candidatus Altiarchaeota archaeon]